LSTETTAETTEAQLVADYNAQFPTGARATMAFRGEVVRVVQREAVVVVGYQPGNGSRYDLEILPRVGGGYLLVWDGVGAYGRLYPSEAHRGGRAEWQLRAGKAPKPDREAIEALAGELYRRGVLR
jgi:hypothetical protein